MDASSIKLESEQYRLQDVELTGRTLGNGSHADVKEVHYMGLTCAAKRFTFTRHCRHLEEDCSIRCHQYCCFLGKLRHPNLVQFIGFWREPESVMPTLVYECLHTTLVSCISKNGVLPECMSYSILKDIATALRFLHERPHPIAHRSMTASKVLLTRDMTAKLTDVGITDVTFINSRASEVCDNAMVPQIVIRPSVEMELKSDIYSLGLLVIYILSGKSPLSELASLENIRSVSFCESDIVQVLLNSIDEGHVLLKLTEKCLNIEPLSRPSAITAFQKISQISANNPQLYNNSLEMLQKIKNDEECMQTISKKFTSQTSEDFSQSNELDRLKELVTKISARNVALEAKLISRKGSISSSREESPVELQNRQLLRQDNQYIGSPLNVS